MIYNIHVKPEKTGNRIILWTLVVTNPYHPILKDIALILPCSAKYINIWQHWEGGSSFHGFKETGFLQKSRSHLTLSNGKQRWRPDYWRHGSFYHPLRLGHCGSRFLDSTRRWYVESSIFLSFNWQTWDTYIYTLYTYILIYICIFIYTYIICVYVSF